jgi:glyoxylase-like metal-dependent hydrolase (beta-lactamase superfamily II)
MAPHPHALGRYGTLTKRLAEFDLTPGDIDMVFNSHCHYDHVEANYLFKGKPLVIHEKEIEYTDRLYWPEWRKAFMDIMEVDAIKGDKQVTKNIKVVETLGHTPGSITALVDTDDGMVALVGDAVIVKEDLLDLKPPTVVTMNVAAEEAVESLRKIKALNPDLVIPGHDAPFTL